MIIKFINKARLILQKLDKINFEQQQIKLILHKLQESIGRIENRQIDGFTKNSIFDNEFRAFSQW
ncbi:MAG: hypothetical protein ACKPB9_25380, partial [Dolichospermum sp.]